VRCRNGCFELRRCRVRSLQLFEAEITESFGCALFSRVTHPAVSRRHFGHPVCLSDVSSFTLHHRYFPLAKVSIGSSGNTKWRVPSEFSSSNVVPTIGSQQRMCALFESQDLAALDKFEILSPSLSEVLGALRFDRLRDAVEDLDFQQGARLLREARL